MTTLVPLLAALLAVSSDLSDIVRTWLGPIPQFFGSGERSYSRSARWGRMGVPSRKVAVSIPGKRPALR
jgi:hypothetical protein